MTYIGAWLYIIGTAARAKKLRGLLDRLPLGSVDVDAETGVSVYTPPMCPTLPLFGARESAKLYASPVTRPALDAWDQQSIGKEDLRRLCYEIEKGKYVGLAFEPESSATKRAA